MMKRSSTCNHRFYGCVDVGRMRAIVGGHNLLMMLLMLLLLKQLQVQ